jgi:hypothetical protein
MPLLAGGAILLIGMFGVIGGGRSEAASRGFTVGQFDRIQSGVPFDIRVRTGAAPSVHAQGPKEALDRLVIEVQGGQLVIRTQRGNWWPHWNTKRERAVIDVTVPTLTAAALNGPGDMSIDRVSGRAFAATLNGPGDLSIGSVETGDLTLAVSGPGDLKVTGRTTTARVTLRGPGDIRASDLTARDATVTVSGPGDVALTATGTVTGSLNGPGDVTIRGGARCTITKHGPGDVRC